MEAEMFLFPSRCATRWIDKKLSSPNVTGIIKFYISSGTRDELLRFRVGNSLMEQSMQFVVDCVKSKEPRGCVGIRREDVEGAEWWQRWNKFEFMLTSKRRAFQSKTFFFQDENFFPCLLFIFLRLLAGFLHSQQNKQNIKQQSRLHNVMWRNKCGARGEERQTESESLEFFYLLSCAGKKLSFRIYLLRVGQKGARFYHGGNSRLRARLNDQGGLVFALRLRLSSLHVVP